MNEKLGKPLGYVFQFLDMRQYRWLAKCCPNASPIWKKSQLEYEARHPFLVDISRARMGRMFGCIFQFLDMRHFPELKTRFPESLTLWRKSQREYETKYHGTDKIPYVLPGGELAWYTNGDVHRVDNTWVNNRSLSRAYGVDKPHRRGRQRVATTK